MKQEEKTIMHESMCELEEIVKRWVHLRQWKEDLEHYDELRQKFIESQ